MQRASDYDIARHMFFRGSESLASELMDVVLENINVEDDTTPLADEDVLLVLRAIALLATPFFTAITSKDDKKKIAETMMKEMLSGKKKLDS